MTEIEVITAASDSGLTYYGMGKDRAKFLYHLQAFAALVAAQERKAWEHKFAIVQNLMDVREIQPNKPCCLAARADEREACAKLFDNQNIWDEDVAIAIRARGTT